MRKEVSRTITILIILFLVLFFINNIKKEKINGNSVFDSIKNIFNQPVGKQIDKQIQQTNLRNNFDTSEVNIAILKQQTANLQEQTFTGTLAILHQDDFENPENSKFYYYLQSNGVNYRLISDDEIIAFPQSNIEVSGKLVQNKIYIEDINENSFKVIEEKQPLQRLVPQNRKLAVILVNFIDNPSEPITVQEAQDTVFGTTRDFYLENSYNGLNLYGEVYGYYTLNINSTCLPLDATIDIADPEIYYPDYDGIVIMFPEDPSYCGFAGAGSLGEIIISTDDGNVSLSAVKVIFTNSDAYVTSHEIGHNLVLYHANWLDCGLESVPPYNICTSIEYGDIYSTMGAWNTFFHFNAYHKDLLGWFLGNDIIEITQSGTYQISPIEINNNLPQAIKIPRGDGRYYYIEYRQPIGFDENINWNSNEVINGALIHFDRYWLYNSLSSYLIDTSPPYIQTPDFFTIKPGETYYDDISGLSIGTLNATNESLLLNISFYPSICERNNPRIIPPHNPITIVDPENPSYQYLHYDSQITNNDESCFLRYFSTLLTAEGLAESSVGLSDYGIAAGETTTPGYTLRLLSNMSEGNYTLLFTYEDDVGYNESVEFYYYYPSCSDGTINNQCSITKPLYCEEGNLIAFCQACGCPNNLQCQPSYGGCSSIIEE